MAGPTKLWRSSLISRIRPPSRSSFQPHTPLLCRNSMVFRMHNRAPSWLLGFLGHSRGTSALQNHKLIYKTPAPLVYPFACSNPLVLLTRLCLTNFSPHLGPQNTNFLDFGIFTAASSQHWPYLLCQADRSSWRSAPPETRSLTTGGGRAIVGSAFDFIHSRPSETTVSLQKRISQHVRVRMNGRKALWTTCATELVTRRLIHAEEGPAYGT